MGKNLNFQAAVKRLAAKNGELIVDCAFAAPHELASLPFEDLMYLMQQLLEKNVEKEGYLSGSLHEDSFAGHEDDDEWGVHNKPCAQHIKTGEIHAMEVDPTVKEKYRIFEGDEKSALHVCAQNYQRKRMAALKVSDPQPTAVMTYIPCQIRFSLFGVCLSSRKAGQGSRTITRSGPAIIDRSSSDAHAPWLCIGRDDTAAALIASTLWFSLDAGRAIWSTIVGATSRNSSSGMLAVVKENVQHKEENGEEVNVNIAKCMAYASSQNWGKYQELLQREEYFEAYQSLYVPVLYSSEVHLVAPIVRMSRSLPSKLKVYF